ncbi:hypothetical protein HYH02_013455 [Chlamydomonas schloesseri]|uniref:Methionyl-tRNA formyltransferase, mitochondrial n=1 Tax=Chlamydomonas schloesseri TaxID=2026947 RepID=A0A835STR4_9CHLO|nr:hypothetical protein HYH02_013455 [Chlamydomonas schloesseri]|eukprot:KAG2431327.1 hypothetical protein HYH02_013455 [Chlamydomonas schloesseri]
MILGKQWRPFTASGAPTGRHARHGRSRRLAVTASASTNGDRKQRVVFLGTPDVAAGVLRQLLSASQQAGAQFEVSMVVSQPGKPRGRGNRAVAQPSPVEALARDSGLLAPEAILCPARAKEESFLAALAELQPDLCVTAAYGNMLPQRFLDTPRLGTLNVHPSLLPLYRGAAPVQRALEDGVKETGVSVAYTVLACDAGPVLAQQRVAVDPDIQAPELLTQLFGLGTQLLLDRLPDVWAGRGQELAVAQDESKVLHAAKLGREESMLDFGRGTAEVIHNRVRGFAGWPGTSARFEVTDEASGASEVIEVKILRTRLPREPRSSSSGSAAGGAIVFEGDAMLVPCAGGGVLEVLQVQPPTKKAMAAKDWKNGLRGKRLTLPAAAPQQAVAAV